MKTQNWFTYKGPQAEKFKRPSQTIPDQSLSIAQIMERYARGMPLSVHQYEPLYEDEEDQDLGLPDMSRLDKIEQIEAYREQAERFESLQTKQEKERIMKRSKKEQETAQKIKDLEDQLKGLQSAGPAGPVPPSGTGEGPRI